jgi:hypothetical protein
MTRQQTHRNIEISSYVIAGFQSFGEPAGGGAHVVPRLVQLPKVPDAVGIQYHRPSALWRPLFANVGGLVLQTKNSK